LRRFVWEESAKQQLRRVEQRQALEIPKALTRLAKGEELGKIKKLTDDPNNLYRFRFGDWRVLFKYERTGIIHVYAVGDRKDIYRG
jgi:mRNA-degrading endonuclease RelE of RelBE toxin-antitoxin system